jgi:hypothetical protein
VGELLAQHGVGAARGTGLLDERRAGGLALGLARRRRGRGGEVPPGKKDGRQLPWLVAWAQRAPGQRRRRSPATAQVTSPERRGGESWRWQSAAGTTS